MVVRSTRWDISSSLAGKLHFKTTTNWKCSCTVLKEHINRYYKNVELKGTVPLKDHNRMHLEVNIEKNYLWSKMKQIWAVLQKIQFKLTWMWRKQRNPNVRKYSIINHSWSDQFLCLNANISVTCQYIENQPKTWRTDTEIPIQQKKQLYSLKKEVEEKLHLIFINFAWTTFVNELPQKYAPRKVQLCL